MFESSHALPPHSKIDKYEIYEVLGEGGFGITYRGENTVLHKAVAIKEYLPADQAIREDSTLTVKPRANRVDDYKYGLDQFLKEGRHLATFNHPNIVRVVDFIEANGTAYLVMDFEQGQSLGTYLKQNPGPVSEEKLIQWITDILTGLIEIHQTGLLHRDIKPDNIYLREKTDEALLIDFGASRYALGAQTQSITAIATQGYAPPEQYTSQGNQGPYTDIYALGAVMYQLVTGRKPLDSTDRSHQIFNTGTESFKPALVIGKGEASDWLLKLIDQMLQLRTMDRPQNCEQVLKAIQNKEPVKMDDPDRTVLVSGGKGKGGEQGSGGSHDNGSKGNGGGQDNSGQKYGDDFTSSKNMALYISLAIVSVLVIGGSVIWWLSSSSEQPDETVRPTETVQPAETTRPVAPVHPIETIQPAETTRPVAPVQPIETVQPVETTRPVETVRPIETVQPVETIRPVETVRPIEAVQPVETTRPVEAVQPTETARPVETKLPPQSTKPVETVSGHKPSDPNKKKKIKKVKLELTSNIKGSLVSLNGKEKGTTPLTLSLIRGRTTEVSISKRGYITQTLKIKLRKNDKRHIELKPSGEFVAGISWVDPNFGIEMVAIEKGCFNMGSPVTEMNRDLDEAQHQVCITKDFWMGKYEVTQKQWKSLMGRNPSSFTKCGDNCPVENVNWNRVQDFIKKLNQRSNKKYRLPTEAEWEYAARAGTKTPFYTGRCLEKDQANYKVGRENCIGESKSQIENILDPSKVFSESTGSVVIPPSLSTLFSEGSTKPVGSYPPNPWGLYDMHGNVREWTCSEYFYKYNGTEQRCYKPGVSIVGEVDNVNELSNRGGSWGHDPQWARSAERDKDLPTSNNKSLGFRLVREK